MGLRSAKRDEKFIALDVDVGRSFDSPSAAPPVLKWFRNGRSFVPPRRLKARVRGVIGLRAEVEVLWGVLGLVGNSLSDMAGTFVSLVGESSRWAYLDSRAMRFASRAARWEEEGKQDQIDRPSWAANMMLLLC